MPCIYQVLTFSFLLKRFVFKTHFCSLKIILLFLSQGPYNHLPLVYGLSGGLWLLTLLAWLYICFTAVIQPNTALLKLITSIYFCRVGLCVTLCLFWIDCSTIEYFCTSSSASNSVSTLRLLEACKDFLLFVLIFLIVSLDQFFAFFYFHEVG